MAQATIRPEDAVPPAELPEVELYHAHSWWTKYVFSQDAKIIAIQYSCTALAIGFVALVLSWLIRLQLGFPDTWSFISPEQYYQFITMHGMIMVIYLLTALFLGGFGNYLIPLMLGARDMVFPYVNMLSYWIYLLAVLILVASFFVPGGPTGAGWTLYPPQAILSGTPGGADWGIVLMLVSLIVFIIGFTMGGLNYVVTVLQARTRGMTLMRMPLTVWGIFTASVLALLAFPALFVGAVMMLLDRIIGTSFFMPAILEMGQQLTHEGGSPLLFQHLFWFFGHPEVYIVALPAFGIVSDLIATHARRNIFGYRMMVWAIVIIGGLSFVVWAHHMYVSGMNPYFGFFFATTTLIIAVPTALKVYNWVLTLWRGNIRLNVPMLFSLAFIVTFVNGGITGLFLGNAVVDVPLSDTMFVVAHFHMVMGVAPMFVILGAIYHWYPKITGRMLDETMGKIHFWISFIGAYAIFLPLHYIGLMGVPRRYHDLGELPFATHGVETLNEFVSITAFVVGAAQLLFLFNLIWSLRRGKAAGGNPWGATTLEWQTPETPPGHGNFGKELPVVHRWAYDYGVPGAVDDFIPQNVAPSQVRTARPGTVVPDAEMPDRGAFRPAE
jgi:cytochrome c oxidase subunit I